MSSRLSPLPNRVDPFGDIHPDPARGAWTGNRGGRIHEGREIRRRQASRRWICCLLAFKGWRREVMGPGYTHLFFLDEATALAAGHRPCFECRRAAAKAFAAAFGAAQGWGRAAKADEMDAILAAERGGARPSVTAAALAPGAMVASGGAAFLFDGEGFRRWRFEGYVPGEPGGEMVLLTPASTLAALRAGYRAQTGEAESA